MDSLQSVTSYALCEQSIALPELNFIAHLLGVIRCEKFAQNQQKHPQKYICR